MIGRTTGRASRAAYGAVLADPFALQQLDGRCRYPREKPVGWAATEVIRIGDAQVITVASPSVAEKAGYNVRDVPWLWHGGMEKKEATMRAYRLGPTPRCSAPMQFKPKEPRP